MHRCSTVVKMLSFIHMHPCFSTWEVSIWHKPEMMKESGWGKVISLLQTRLQNRLGMYTHITVFQSRFFYRASDSITISNFSSVNEMFSRSMRTGLKRIWHKQMTWLSIGNEYYHSTNFALLTQKSAYTAISITLLRAKNKFSSWMYWHWTGCSSYPLSH